MKNFDRPALSTVLGEGIVAMRLDVSPAQQDKLMDYLALMF